MMLTGFLVLPLLTITDSLPRLSNCSYQAVLNHLELTRENELYLMTRPVQDHNRTTWVNLEVVLYAILDVIEKDQKFSPYVWTVMRWHNEFISWDPDEFCGIDNISLPTEALWQPDVTIEEMIEKDKAPPSPYLTISAEGFVEYRNDQVLVSTCRMHIYKFPFDTQRCNLSFTSAAHSAKHLRLLATDNSSEATEESREVMRTQYEWLFMHMTVTSHNATGPEGQDIIVYSISMKRRPLLYIVNFLLPVLFFLCLDMASFLISDNGGEKLSFKVTVLLAVTVMQLILNEILPSSSNRIPLIAVYCIGNFALMLLSLLETILVMHLMAKDAVTSDEDNGDQTQKKNCGTQGRFCCLGCQREMPQWTTCVKDVSPGESPTALETANKEINCGKVMEELQILDKLTKELRAIDRTMSLVLDGREEATKPRYWTRVAKRLNMAFFVFYVTVVIVFLIFIYLKWIDALD